MTTIYDIKKRAQQLSEKTDSETISPQEVGGLFSDMADYTNDVEVNGSSLGIRKTYTSVSAMEADKNPVGDDGKPLKKGQLVNIYNQDDPSSADNNKVFSWQNPGWQIRTTLDAGYATREELTELENEIYNTIGDNPFQFNVGRIKTNSDEIEIDTTAKQWFYSNEITGLNVGDVIKFNKNKYSISLCVPQGNGIYVNNIVTSGVIEITKEYSKYLITGYKVDTTDIQSSDLEDLAKNVVVIDKGKLDKQISILEEKIIELSNSVYKDFNEVYGLIGEALFTCNIGKLQVNGEADTSVKNWFYSNGITGLVEGDVIKFNKDLYSLSLCVPSGDGLFIGNPDKTGSIIINKTYNSYYITGYKSDTSNIEDGELPVISQDIIVIKKDAIDRKIADLKNEFQLLYDVLNDTVGDINAKLGDLPSTYTKENYTYNVGRITTTTTPDTEVLNYFYTQASLKIGDVVKFDKTKYKIRVSVGNSEDSIFSGNFDDTGAIKIEKNYTYYFICGYKTDTTNVTEDDLLTISNDIYAKIYQENTVADRLNKLEGVGDDTLASMDYAQPIAKNDEIVRKKEWRDAFGYPIIPVFGWEYLTHWYEKIYNADTSVVVAMSGDSTVQGYAPALDGKDDAFYGMRNYSIKKIMKAGNFPMENLRVINCGVGGRNSNEWVGNNQYALSNWVAKYPNGFLDEDMKLNPDLYVMCWGINDADKNHSMFAGLTLQDRVNLFEANVTEAFRRIRGSVPINGRPAYNKNDGKISLVFCLPTVAGTFAASGRGNTWNQLIRERLIPLCRKYQVAFVDLTIKTYGHESFVNWSAWTSAGGHDRIHPNKYSNAQIMSVFQDLIYPVTIWNITDIEQGGEDDLVRYTV